MGKASLATSFWMYSSFLGTTRSTSNKPLCGMAMVTWLVWNVFLGRVRVQAYYILMTTVSNAILLNIAYHKIIILVLGHHQLQLTNCQSFGLHQLATASGWTGVLSGWELHFLSLKADWASGGDAWSASQHQPGKLKHHRDRLFMTPSRVSTTTSWLW